MDFSMTLTAQPPNIKWFEIIVMMSICFICAARFTRPTHQNSDLYGAFNHLLRQNLYSIFRLTTVTARYGIAVFSHTFGFCRVGQLRLIPVAPSYSRVPFADVGHTCAATTANTELGYRKNILAVYTPSGRANNRRGHKHNTTLHDVVLQQITTSVRC